MEAGKGRGQIEGVKGHPMMGGSRWTIEGNEGHPQARRNGGEMREGEMKEDRRGGKEEGATEEGNRKEECPIKMPHNSSEWNRSLVYTSATSLSN